MAAQQTYVDQNYPLWFVEALQKLQQSTVLNASGSTERQWLSQPRRNDDQTWEVLKVKFRKAISISEISFDLPQVGSEYEVYYVDRRDRRQKVLNQSRAHVKGSVATGTPTNWYPMGTIIFPIVATALEIRIRRRNDNVLPKGSLVSVGLRNMLFKRNIYSLEDAKRPFEPEVDPYGNLVSSYVEHWNPHKAMDGNDTSFWKSAPQPAPNAVVNFFVDIRTPDDAAQLIDRFYLDPVYSGQNLNVYSSIDDSIGVRKLQPTPLTPAESVNMEWIKGTGLSASTTTGRHRYHITQTGLDFKKPYWIGVSLIVNDPPSAQNTILGADSIDPENPNTPFSVSLTTGLTLRLSGATTTADLPTKLVAGREYRIGVQVLPNENKIGLFLFNSSGTQLASGEVTSPADPYMLYLGKSDENEFSAFRGTYTALAIKQPPQRELLGPTMRSWAQSPDLYIDPDVSPEGDESSDTINNLLVGGNFKEFEIPFGGTGQDFFYDKEWAPVWKDWVVKRGEYVIPNPTMAKYLKFEFTNLTEEPYPIWESGIEVKYQTLPITVTNTKTTKSTEVTTQTKTSSELRGQMSSSTRTTYDSYDYYNIEVTTGNVGVTKVLRQGLNPVSDSFRTEKSSSDVYRRSSISSVTLAQDKFYTVVRGDYLIKIGNKQDIPWREIYNMNKNKIDNDPRVKMLPRRSEGWWIFPGQQLRISTKIMDQITKTTTVTTRKKTVVERERFTATQVHRYETQTVKRDAAIAYFAGVREIKLYTANYLTQTDQKYIIRSFEDFTVEGGEFTVDPDTGLWRGSGAPTVITSAEFPSTTPWATVRMSVLDRGLQELIVSRTTLRPLGLDSSEASWESSSAQWADPVATWGAGMALTNVEFDPNYIYGGLPAIRIKRPNTDEVATAGIFSPNFTVRPNQRVRVSTNLLRSDYSDNTIIIRIVDSTNNDVLFTQTLTGVSAGAWIDYTSDFWTVTAQKSVHAQLIVVGESEDEMFISSLSVQATSILYEISNGGPWQDLTEVIHRSPASFTFGTPSVLLKVRATLFYESDYIVGMDIDPHYLI